MEISDGEAWVECVEDPAVADPLVPEVLARALAQGRLLAEADCMNDGFLLHNFGTSLELRMHDGRGEFLKGLEAIVEGYEQLGFTLAFE